MQIGFQALGFLAGVDVMGDMGLLSVNPSGVDTIAASRICLNYCWCSPLPACLYIFDDFKTFMFIILPT